MTAAAALLAGLAGISLLVFGVMVSRLIVCAPVLDTIAILGDWLDSRSGVWGTLWQPLNEHHVVWLRLLAPGDFVLAGGWPVLSSTVSILLLGCMVAVPALALRRSGLGLPLRCAGVALIVVAVFSAPSAEAAAIVANGVYPQVAGLGMISLGLVAADRPWLAFVFAVAASFGNGVGLILFPILCWQVWRRGGRWRQIVPLALAGGIYCLVYLDGISPPLHALPSAASALKYAVAMLGLPASRSTALGVAGMVSGGVIGILALVGLCFRPKDELTLLAHGGILFGLGAAVLGAVSRTDMAGGVPAVRYTVLILPLLIGLLCLALQRTPPSRLSSAVWTAALGLLLLAQSMATGRATLRALTPMHEAIQAFARGARDPALAPFIYPDLGTADRVWAGLSSRGIAICAMPSAAPR